MFCPDADAAFAATLRTGRPKVFCFAKTRSRATAYRPVWEVPCRLGETTKTFDKNGQIARQLLIVELCALPTWWFWRSGCTRSHSEHGRETLQRRWYFDLSHGRVGRCQVCKTQSSTNLKSRTSRQRPENNTGRPQSGPLSL